MEDGLVLFNDTLTVEQFKGLNPCCSGRWSRTLNDGTIYPASGKS